ncbi:hypothetical protein F0562_004196 [Nyssa sinensis]|uniref:NPH3 domain-containing protein n=1 Tax=Nyssa sinensis TaxID=561372 RepID=A0A5J5C1G8_9ASTE|nr:hypothetical protein F0562_004196 [Nyssa sinensis]
MFWSVSLEVSSDLIVQVKGSRYLLHKTHPDLNKNERRHFCRILDCKKLSVEACMHAAQNELLPLRVVVQVLFFGQARVSMAGGQVTELPNNIKALLATHDDPSKPSTHTTVPAEDQWSVSRLKSPKSKLSTLRMKLAEDNDLDENFEDGIGNPQKLRLFVLFLLDPKGCSVTCGPSIEVQVKRIDRILSQYLFGDSNLECNHALFCFF